MTAPALPPEVEAAIRDYKDAVIRYYTGSTSYGGQSAPAADYMVDRGSALRAAIARALGGDGEPVAWAVTRKNGTVKSAHTVRSDAESDCDLLNMPSAIDSTMVLESRPYTVVPLYTRPAATGDTGEGERAKVAAWEAAHDSLRDDVLHNADGFDNDTVNHYLGMIDDADQRPYTHIATKGGPDAR